MKKSLISVGVMLALSACSTTGFQPNDKYETVAGYPFKTNLSCTRTKPVGLFDPKCDYPRLGFKGFSPMPDFSVGSGVSGS
jgi:hypothetical protein